MQRTNLPKIEQSKHYQAGKFDFKKDVPKQKQSLKDFRKDEDAFKKPLLPPKGFDPRHFASPKVDPFHLPKVPVQDFKPKSPGFASPKN